MLLLAKHVHLNFLSSFHPVSVYGAHATELVIPSVDTTTYGLHSFRYYASKLCNSLPDSISCCFILVPRGRAPFDQHQESRPLARSNIRSPRFTNFPSLCACSESSLTNLIGCDLNLLCLQSHSKTVYRWTGPEVAILVGTWCLFPYCLFFKENNGKPLYDKDKQ